MDTKKSRAYLKQLFQAGRVPTESDFDILIDSQVNVVDDQLLRRQDGKDGDSLSIGMGKNKTLMSFFSSLNNSAGEWSLRLSNNSQNLNFTPKENAQPLLSLDPSGKVGIGTDNPQTELDVRGDISANGLCLTDTLQVDGIATVKALSIPGFGTITDVDSLKRLLGTAQSGTSAQIPSVTPAPIASPTPTGGGSTKVPEAPPISTPSPGAVKTIPASRIWQKIAGPFTGFQAIQVIAWLDTNTNRSISHATAVCVDGDASSSAIQPAQSYQGRPGAKINFRWNGDKTAYYLECRTRLKLPSDTVINYKIDPIFP